MASQLGLDSQLKPQLLPTALVGHERCAAPPPGVVAAGGGGGKTSQAKPSQAPGVVAAGGGGGSGRRAPGMAPGVQDRYRVQPKGNRSSTASEPPSKEMRQGGDAQDEDAPIGRGGSIKEGRTSSKQQRSKSKPKGGSGKRRRRGLVGGKVRESADES